MIGATLYLVGRECETGELVPNAAPCSMCRRMIINSGISTVIIRRTEETYESIDVCSAWVENDESLNGDFEY